MKRLLKISILYDYTVNNTDLTIIYEGLENEKSEVLFEEDANILNAIIREIDNL